MTLYGWTELDAGQVEWPHGFETGPRRAVDAAKWWRDRGITNLFVFDRTGSIGGVQQWHMIPGLRMAGHQLHYAGGVRSMTQVQQILDGGVGVVAVGDLALDEPRWLHEVSLLFPEQVHLLVRLEDGKLIRENGQPLTQSLEEFVQMWSLQPPEGFVVLATEAARTCLPPEAIVRGLCELAPTLVTGTDTTDQATAESWGATGLIVQGTAASLALQTDVKRKD